MKILTDKRRLELAKQLAYVAHRTQVDKCGEPYFQHLDRVAKNCKSISAKIIAYLHDIVEDKHITQSGLEQMGFLTGHELWCIEQLDKNNICTTNRLGKEIPQDIAYRNYIMHLYKYPLTREVKLADLLDNSNVSRFIRTNTPMTDKDKARLRKYASAIAILQD